MSTVFLFGGQGSQYYQMGRELYESSEVFKQAMDALDLRIRERTGRSIVQEIYRGDKQKGDLIWPLEVSHVAIFMLEYALFQLLESEGIRPDVVLGTSVGEWCAALVAGAVTLDGVLDALLVQVEQSSVYCEPGGMMAVVANTSLFERSPELHQETELAAVNFERHFVVSGSKRALDEVAAWIETTEAIAQLLPVPYPFHSSLIARAAEAYTAHLRAHLVVTKPKIRMISSLEGREIEGIDPEYFWRVARHTIRFRDALRSMGDEVERSVFVDLGPAGTLANFVSWNLGRKTGAKILALTNPSISELKLLDRARAAFTRP
jgi:bacillaene synthase trans-acting acyltransferase